MSERIRSVSQPDGEARLLEDAKRARNLSAVVEISAIINSSLSLDHILNTTCKSIVELLGVGHSGLMLFSPDHEIGEVRAEYPEVGMKGQKILLRDAPSWERFIESKAPLIVSDIETDPSLGVARDNLIKQGIRSILIVPVIGKQGLLGSFGLDAMQDVRVFSEEEIELCQLFATQVAVAIENAQLYEQTRQRAEQLDALRQTTLAITSLVDRDTLLNTIIQQAVGLLDAKSGGIYEYYPEHGELSIIADYGRPEQLVGVLKVGDGMAGRLVQSGEQFKIVDDYNNWPEKASIYDTSRPFGAVLEVPLKWQNRISGVLYVDDEVGRVFTDKDARLLGLFAEQAAIAMANSELVVKDANKLRRLQRLSEISSEIVSDLSSKRLEERLSLIARRAVEILEAEACGISLVRRKGVLSLEANYGHREEVAHKGREFHIISASKGGLTGHIAKEGKLFNAWGSDLTDHWAVKGEEVDHVASESCYSLLALPLKKGDKLIGLLRVENKLGSNGKPRQGLHFTQEDEWILNSFGQAVVVAIEEAKLVSELTEQKDHLARLVASSPNGIIAIDAHGRITEFNEQAVKILGYTADEVKNERVSKLYYDPDEPVRIGGELILSAEGKITDYETHIKSKDEQAIPISLCATWLYDADKNLIGSVGYFEDLRPRQEKERQIELLLRASNVIAQAESVTEGLQSLAQMMVPLLSHTFCRILLLDEEGTSLVVEAAYPIARDGEGLKWNPELNSHIALSEYECLYELLEAGKPTILQWTDERFQTNLSRFSARLGLESPVRSLLLVPLKIQERLVGLLDLGEMRSEQRSFFNEEKIELVTAIADQATVLIDRMRLYDATRRRNQLLAALDESSRRIRAERETHKIMQEVVRLAAELAGCAAGGLYINRPHIEQLELSVTHGFGNDLQGSQLPRSQGLAGLVARTRKSEIITDYSNWPERENIFEPFGFETVAAIPLKQGGEVEAVLFVADTSGQKHFTRVDTEVLERFAAQASIALQTATLMNREQRMTSQLTILHKISDYIQAASDLDKILHVVLTGVTADYGLRFNRAVLLLLSERRNYLVGRMGIGQFEETAARAAWEEDNERGIYDFSDYIELLENDQVLQTPVGASTLGLRLPVNKEAADVFSRAVLERRYICVESQQLNQLPGSFAQTFNPTTPVGVVPLMARNEVIGLLVVDNKFTQAPITIEGGESLMTFAGTAAIAIQNTLLLQQILSGRESLLNFYNLSSELAAIHNPTKLLHAVVRQTHQTARATWVSLLLIDEMGRAQNPIVIGKRTHLDDEHLIRRNGISMKVFRTGVAEVIEDISKRSDVNPVMAQGSTQAAVCLPLSLPGKRIGVMWIHYNEPRYFSEFEIAALQLYVNQIASAYDNSRQMESLEKMRTAAAALAATTDVQRVCEQIVLSAREVLDADISILWFYDDERGNFILENSKAAGIDDAVREKVLEIGPQHGKTTYTVLNGEWIAVEDVDDPQQNQLLSEEALAILKEIGVCGLQGIALSAGEKKLGVLFTGYKQPRSFEEEYMGTSLTFANHAALALEKAKLIDQVVKANKATEAIARVMVLEDRETTLDLIAEVTKETVGCSAVVVFEYDDNAHRLTHPPRMAGVKYLDKAISQEEITDYTLVHKILDRDKPYIVENTADNEHFKRTRFTRDEGIKSCVAIPLRAGEQKVGVMFVNYWKQRRFTADELCNIGLFANYAAVAIRNAQLFGERSRQLREQAALLQLSQELLGTVALQETMTRAVEVAADVLKTPFSKIVLLDKDKRLIFRAAFGWEQEMIGNFVLGAGKESQTGYTIERQEYVKVDDYEQEKRFKVPPIVFEREIKSGLSVPMFQGGEIVGAMLVHTITPRRFTKEEASLLSLIANQTAIAMQSAERFEAIERQRAYLDTLYKASKAITASFGPDRKKVLDQIVKQAVECVRGGQEHGSVAGTIQLYNGESQALVIESACPLEGYPGIFKIGDERLLNADNLEKGKIGISGRAILSGKPQLVADVSKDKDYVESIPSTRSELAMPLKDQDKVCGVLNVESNRLNGFDKDDLKTLQALADLAVIVINNAKLYQEMVHTKGMVGSQTALAWMGMASSAWLHGVRSDAITISNSVSLLRTALSSGAENSSKKIEEKLAKIESLVKKILDRNITPPLSSEDKDTTPVIVEDLIRERIKQMWMNDPERLKPIKYVLKLPKTHKSIVRANSEWLRRAFDMLVDNAIDAMLLPEPVPDPSLTISTRRISGSIEIAISDTGRGMPEEVQAKLFHQPIPKIEEDSKGLGIGLLMVQAILQTYGGEIRLDSTGPDGTTFVILLPRDE